MIPNIAHNKLPNGRVLVLAPHPDDEVFGCGGAIIKHVRQGNQVKVVIVTDGGLPVIENQISDDYVEMRKNESINAGKILGYGTPDFLGYPDGDLENQEDFSTQLLKILNDFNPQIIYLPSSHEIHTDHIALNRKGIEVLQKINLNFQVFFYEIGQALSPNFFLNITDIHTELENAMLSFKSQLEAQDYYNQIIALHRYRSYTLGKNVKYAEAYLKLNSEDLKADNMEIMEEKSMLNKNNHELKNEEVQPLISVIVRSMNRPHLAKTLTSIANQTYSNLEILIVDASGENTVNPGERCGPFPVIVISLNKPLNRPQAANVGIDHINGSYFGFLDDDDILLENHFSSLYHSMINSNSKVCYSSISVIHPKKGHIKCYNQDFNRFSLIFMNYIPIHALLYDRQILESGFRFDENLEYYEDWDFILQVSEKFQFYHIAEVTAIYNLSLTSNTHFNPDTIKKFKGIMYAKWVKRLNGLELIHFIDYLVKYHPTESLRLSEIQLNNELMQAKQLADEISMEYNKIKNSLSWRLTSPFRYILRPFLIKKSFSR